MSEMSSFSPGVTNEQVQAGLMKEHTDRGFSSTPSAMFDHVFPESEIAYLDANGEVQWNFKRPYADKLVISYIPFEAGDLQPVVMKGKSWVQDGQGRYTGVILKGYRGKETQLLGTTVVGINVAVGNQTVKAFAGGTGNSLEGVEIHLRAGVKA